MEASSMAMILDAFFLVDATHSFLLFIAGFWMRVKRVWALTAPTFEWAGNRPLHRDVYLLTGSITLCFPFAAACPVGLGLWPRL